MCLTPIWSWSQSQYSNHMDRPIKALSEKEISDLSEGNGMGFAIAAELNHYPGPKHVLELSDQLALSPTQLDQTQLLFNDMKAEAINLGNKLIELESQLDQWFANSQINPAKLQAQLEQIANVKAQLRFVHLSTHLKQKAILTQHQIHQYDRLRGYTSSQHQHNNHS